MLGPIFQREWLTVPRRPRHYVSRAAYLGIIWVLGVTAWQVTVTWSRTPTLGDTSRFGPFLFQTVCFLQLTLLLFFAALSGASAITQEKDRRTFLLLLLTDLRNYEIVLGKLAGSLLQIGLLLAGTVPVLMILVLLGGIAPGQVVEAVLIMGCTGLAAGSLGSVIALWRDKTFQALALTVLMLVLYLALVRALTVLPSFSGVSPRTVEQWQSWLDPFQSLQGVLAADEQLAIRPALGFTLAMLIISTLLNAWGILRLRVWNPSGEPIMQREKPEDADEEKDRAKAHAAPGIARHVWDNPIIWREMRTRAYGRRPLMVKVAYFLVLALIGYYALDPLWHPGEHASFAAARGLVPVAVLSLLLVAAQAVTAITSERDTGALDLLLVTDLTPQEFIYGKLGGIAWNTLVYLVPPVLLAIIYGYAQLMATPPAQFAELGPQYNLEATICVVGATALLLGFVMVLGLHVALRTRNSRVAVLNTLGTVFFLTVGTLVCIYLILINGRFEYQWTSFVFFLGAGIGGLWWVLNGERPSAALTLASWACPIGVFYTVTAILVGKPGSQESADPVVPFLVIAAAFGFAIAAMLVPLVSEFDVALGRTTGGGE